MGFMIIGSSIPQPQIASLCANDATS